MLPTGCCQMARGETAFRADPELMLLEGVVVSVMADGNRLSALVDTGAAISCIDIATAELLGWREVEGATVVGVTSEGRFPAFEGRLDVPILRAGIPSPIQGLPLGPESGFTCRVIIGRDVLGKFEMCVNWVTGEVRFLRP